MLWAPALVLMTVASPVTASRPLASTYDEAACPPTSDVPPPPQEDEVAPGACSEQPLVVAPAIVDCNDPGMSPWLEEMIGSCDMPRPAPPLQGAPTVVRSPHGSSGTTRVCDGLHCSRDTTPLRSAPRPDDDGAQLLVSTASLAYRPEASALSARLGCLSDQVHLAPPERPPRA
jgi:hypothetical protein